MGKEMKEQFTGVKFQITMTMWRGVRPHEYTASMQIKQ